MPNMMMPSSQGMEGPTHLKVSGAKKAMPAKSAAQREKVFPIKSLILLRVFMMICCEVVFKGNQGYTP